MQGFYIGKLKNGKTVASLIKFATLFEDNTFIPACKPEAVDKLTPHIKEKEVLLKGEIKTISLVKYLTDEQKCYLDKIQKNVDLVLLPRVILDALAEDTTERSVRFHKCVGQKFTQASVNLPSHQRVVETNVWMY